MLTGCAIVSARPLCGNRCSELCFISMSITSHGIGDRGPPAAAAGAAGAATRSAGIDRRVSSRSVRGVDKCGASLSQCVPYLIAVCAVFLSIIPLCCCSSSAASAASRPMRKLVAAPNWAPAQQQQRAPRVCPSYEDLDAGSRAYLAAVVFEGKARSKSDVHAGLYRVTFDIVTVFKGDVAANSQVRLEFLAPNARNAPRASNSTSVTVQQLIRASSATSAASASSPGRKVRGCVVSADIRTGRRYIVFASRLSPNNFTAVGSPVVHTKKAFKDVKSTVCQRCGQ